MIPRQPLLVVSGFACCFAVGAGLLFLLRPEPGVTKENFHRLRLGQSESRVSAVLGSNDASLGPGRGTYTRIWWANDIRIVLRFTSPGGALEEGFFCTDADPENREYLRENYSLFDVLGAWLQL
jgi:hypothetical protein